MCSKSKFNSVPGFCRVRRGFTLVEVVVVAGIITLLASFMIVNFPRTRLDLDETTSIVTAEIRNTQAKAMSSSRLNGAVRCGYGIHYETITSYSIYAGPDSQTSNCSDQNRNLNGSDPKVQTFNLLGSKLEFKNIFKDIFFEPPNPNVYIDNAWSLRNSQPITVGKKNESCSSSTCKTICVYASGKIETLPGLINPCP